VAPEKIKQKLMTRRLAVEYFRELLPASGAAAVAVKQVLSSNLQNHLSFDVRIYRYIT
jgi:hypothetical protein